MDAPSRSGPGLEEALASDVLVRDGRRLRFSHPLIAAVVQLRLAEAAVRHAESSEQPFLLSQALSNIAFIRHNAGGGVQRELLLRARIPQPFDRARTLLALGTAQRRAKQRAEACVPLEAALAVFEELGAVVWADRAPAE